jgi:glycosyltransferase involved in cell wall biosynthesis
VAHASRYARCVIASDVGAVGNLIRQFGFGFTVEPESPEKLRDAIRKFLDLTASQRLEMESKAKLAAQSYSWDEMCHRIEEVYYRCTGARGCVKVLQA